MLPHSIDPLLMRPTAFDAMTGTMKFGEFEHGPERREYLAKDAKILVIGAGGLGCELLKDLALSGFKNIHVIDMDGIDISNLNRQFLFRKSDVGKKKAEVAAKFIMSRVPDCNVTYSTCSIQEMDDLDSTFYKKFNLIIAGLDNLDARRWINQKVYQNLQWEEDGSVDPESIVPIIDGGTEGFGGQVKFMVAPFTPCFDCGINTFPQQEHFPLCTIAETPRKPEHCVAYAFMIEWPKIFPERKYDADSPKDMEWIYQTALVRAEKYGIEGVTYFFTIGVVKNVIPAIASTNALISAACVNEAFKALTFCSQILDNFFQYNGHQTLNGSVFKFDKLENCAVCGNIRLLYTLPKAATLQDLMDRLTSDKAILPDKSCLTAPSVRSGGLTLFMQKPLPLRQACERNLGKTLVEIGLANGAVCAVTDPNITASIELTVSYE